MIARKRYFVNTEKKRSPIRFFILELSGVMDPFKRSISLLITVKKFCFAGFIKHCVSIYDKIHKAFIFLYSSAVSF